MFLALDVGIVLNNIMTAEGSATESDSEVEPLAKGVAMILSIVERSIH